METLRRILAQEDTVLFVGSGVSMWSGVPSWAGFIQELAQFVELSGQNADLIRLEVQRGDLLQAASYGFDKLTKHQIGEFVRKACRYGIAKPHAIHQKLVSLGPRCFVTTNYDNLIEESLRLWRQDRFFGPPVTNRNLTETAEIIHARATDFVFKPHGDAADSESIILTREQYRQLLPGGERHAALESIKMLLATRPVVYIGFGLRDPDFMYLRDLLSNTYKGGIRDHFAIMADVSEAEANYWRKNYGIHLVGYVTTEEPNKSRNHSLLLNLLDELIRVAPPTKLPEPTSVAALPCPPNIVLALARHAARLTRSVRKSPEFPLRVHAESNRLGKKQKSFWRDEFDHYPVERFLDEGPSRALLIGLPGSGKTYSLQRAASRLAERLHELCLKEKFDEKSVVVPLLADLKLYRGDLFDLVNGILPSGVSLDYLSQEFKMRIFLDSFNEMPREYWETGSYEADFARFFERNSECSIIIGSRTSDGLDRFEFPSYHIDQIDESFVASELTRLQVSVSGRFQHEIRRLLQQPFYFQLVVSGTVSLPDEAHPRDFYRTFFSRLESSFRERFGRPFDLEHALSQCAYEAVNRGEEAQLLVDFLEVLQAELTRANLEKLQAAEVTNWLVAQSVLIPYRGARVAFFHQSATEYLAACELARRYQQNPDTLNEKLQFMRWDQALFLALSLLPASDSEAFFQAVLKVDFPLGLRAAKYVEFGRDEVVSKLLDEIPRQLEGDDAELDLFVHLIESAVEYDLPISETHESQIRTLLKLGGLIGGAAAKRLVELKGASVKDELLQVMLEARDDYNYCCNGIGDALQPLADPVDIQKIVALADSAQLEMSAEDVDDYAHGFTAGAAAFLKRLDLRLIREAFLPKENSEPISKIRADILTNILLRRHSTEALELSAELLVRGADGADTTIYFISEHAAPEDQLNWSAFSSDHIDCLVSKLAKDEHKSSWALKALKCLCVARPHMAEAIKVRSLAASGIEKAALLYCANSEDMAPVFEALSELEKMKDQDRGHEPTHLLKQIDLDWHGKETLLMRLMRLRDSRLTLALIEPLYVLRPTPIELRVGPVEWWLEWLSEEVGTDLGFWFCDRMAWLFATLLNAEDRQAFVSEFNREDSRFRQLIADVVLRFYPDVTTDNFSDDAISFLLTNLSRSTKTSGIYGHLLGSAATERFVSERLSPLVPHASPELSKNLREVLMRAGSRHGRRYIST